MICPDEPPVALDWLEAYLLEALREGLCTDVHCTTCGALEFRQGLLRALTRFTGTQRHTVIDRQSAVLVTVGLSQVHPPAQQSSQLEAAVRLVLCDIWDGLGEKTADRELGPILKGAWAEDVLARLKAHHRKRMEEKRAFTERNDPVVVQRRREEKRQAKQAKLAERAGRKKERDRLWHEKQRCTPHINSNGDSSSGTGSSSS